MRRIVPIALFVAIALASLGPIRNYDLFWHLATGRWIVEHRALPSSDPFALASDRVPWINGEWLFEVILHFLERAVGIAGLSWVRALFIGVLFATAYLLSQRALLASAFGFAGAMATIDLRPSGIAALFVVLAIDTVRANRRQALIVFGVLTALWINVHPSALLAPLIALCIRPRSWFPVIGAGALLVNPHGVHGVLSPLKLMTFVRSGAFVNAEWLPSDPFIFPLLYVSIVWTAAALAAAFYRRKSGGSAAAVQTWQILVFVLFAYLAIRHVRNQPLWFAAFPLLVPTISIKKTLAYAASIALIAWVAIRGDHRLGVSPSRFPIDAVARLKSTGLRGNIYNPDQFGGFLIWSFYPERRVLTDGRNELYRTFIPEYAHARRDQRAWRALLRKYRIDLAVDEYRAPLDVLDAVTRRTTKMPASLAYWPRKEWALIGFDRAGMVFARRAAFPREQIEKWEIRGAVPDAAR